MIRRIAIAICGLCVVFSATYGAETVVVDSLTRHVLNAGVINFAPNQLQIGGIVVGPGGGGGGGINAISLQLPMVLFASPTNFTVDGTGTAVGVASLSNAPAGTIFSNLAGSDAVPIWNGISTFKTAAALNNLDNTSDANKPVSAATQTALNLKADTTAMNSALALKANTTYVDSSIAAYTGTTNLVTLGTITAGTWNGTVLSPTYAPILSDIRVPTASVDLNGNKLINLATPTAGTDATTKSYVDGVAVTGPPHPSVVAATTANGALATAYENGDTIDGVVLATGNRILLKNQTTGTENGIYTVNASGAPTRATDADAGSEVSGSVFVSGGTVNASTTWALATAQPVTLGSTVLSYTQTGANTVYTAGAGLTLTGSQFSISNFSAPSKLLGRFSAGAGAPQEITISTGLTLDGSGNLTAQGTGTVSNFSAGDLSPLFTTTEATTTTTPALSFTLSTAAANTFFGNGTGSTAAPTFMSASTARTALGATTVGANLFSLTNPSAIRFIQINADNSVSAITAASLLTAIGAESPLTFSLPLVRTANAITVTQADASHSGYVTQTDWNHFQGAYANAPVTVLASTCTGTNPCVLTVNSAANPPINQVLLNQVLTTPLNIVLPPSLNYGSGVSFEPIEIVDIIAGTAQTNFGITVTRSSSDTIDGATSISMSRGSTYLRLNPNGLNSWTSTQYRVASFKDGSNPLKTVGIDVSGQTPNAGYFFRPATIGDSVSVQPHPAVAGEVLRGIDAAGQVTASAIAEAEIVPAEFSVGDADTAVTGSGTTNSVRLGTAITQTRTYTFVNADNYSPGETVRFYDSTGSVGTTKFAHVITATSNTFNGVPSIDFTEPFFNRVFVADPVNHNWTVSTFGGTSGNGLALDVWHPITPVSGVATISASSGVTENHHIVTMSGAISLVISNASTGAHGLIKFADTTGNHVVTVPNNVGKTPTTSGTGTFTTSTGTNVEDIYRWDYDGSKFYFSPVGLKYIAAAATCVTAGVTGATSGTNTIVMNAANRAYIDNDFIADATSICAITANLQAIGTPTMDLKAYIMTDGVAKSFVTASTTNGSNTVTLNGTGISTNDVGQHITGPGIPSSTYVGTVDTVANTLTLSSSRTSNVSVNAGVGAGSGQVDVYGMPTTVVNAGGSDPVNATTLPTLLTGSPSADSNPVTFTNVNATGLTVGVNYHVVIGTSASFGAAGWDASNYPAWLQPATNNVGFHTNRASNLTGSYAGINGSKKQRFATFH